MEVHYKIIGCIFIFIALVHMGFPNRFQWKTQLPLLSLINRQVMMAHSFFIAYFVFLNGWLFLLYTAELTINTPLSNALNIGFLSFWFLRFLAQHFFYSSVLWKGKIFETTIHILFTLFWTYVVVTLGIVVIKNVL